MVYTTPTLQHSIRYHRPDIMVSTQCDGHDYAHMHYRRIDSFHWHAKRVHVDQDLSQVMVARQSAMTLVESQPRPATWDDMTSGQHTRDSYG